MRRSFVRVACWGMAFLAGCSFVSTRCPAVEPAEKGVGEGTADDERDRQAVARFQGVLEKNPRRGTALDRVYGYHVERGTLDQLLKTYVDRTTKQPKDGAAWMIRGLIESQRGQDAAAVAAFLEAEPKLPDNAIVSYYLGQSLVLVGQPDAAVGAFERAIQRKPAQAELLEIFQALGRVHQRALRNDQALAVWNRLEKLFPDNQRVQELIATTLVEEGQHAQALPRLESLAKTSKDLYRKSQFRMEAADIKVKLGKTAEAVAQLEQLLGELNPDNWLYREVRRKIEDSFLRSDDQAGLAKYYEGWIAKHAEDVDAMARLSHILAAQARIPEAQKWLEKALQRAPSRKELRIAFIEQLVYDQRFAEAIAQYEALDKADPNNPDILREWGKLILKNTARPEAERKAAAAGIWQRLTAARPKDAVVATQVADLFRQAGMVDEALALYRKSVELAPDSAQYREYLGEYYHSLKRSDEALVTWRAMAAEPQRNSQNLARLGEVLAGFGYLSEAVAAVTEACQLEADDFSLQLKLGDLLEQSEKFDEATSQLKIAARLAGNAEEKEAVLQRQIKILQATDQLPEAVVALQQELKAGRDVSPERWHLLARYLETERQFAEAAVAIRQALNLDKPSIPILAAAARIQESGGDLLAAADTNRKLAAIDRRFRTEYLTSVARLEGRLGRREQALQAGRDLIAAAPGNSDSYEFFAGLCFQLRAMDEGLEALRRSVRANPGEPRVVLTLAEALAEQFRTDEAIELYWRAFEKEANLDSKLSVVSRLAELYLQINQFDRMLERLERERREAGRQRELTICLAQAHHAAGDDGTARQELERLLTQDLRDTQLLQQLSSLAESEGDLAAAVKYQQQLNKVAPGKEGELRQAQLLMLGGESVEATAILVRMATAEDDPEQMLKSVESLLANQKYDAVLAITERLIREQPRNWELLYREGVALANDKPGEAARRFQSLLELRWPDDELGAIAKARQKKPASNATVKPVRASARQAATPQRFPLLERIQTIWEIRYATGLEQHNYYGGQMRSWMPSDFGQARIAAMGWLLNFAGKQNQQEAFVEARRPATGKADPDSRAAWDWYYLQALRHEQRDAYEAARALSKNPDPVAYWLYITSLSGRTADGAGRRAARAAARGEAESEEGRVPALPADELEHVLACYRDLKKQRPELLSGLPHYGLQILTNVNVELKRAKRLKEADQFYRDAVAAADKLESIASAMHLAASRDDMDTLLQLFDKLEWLQESRGKSAAPTYYEGPTSSLAETMNARATAKAHPDILRLFDRYMKYSIAQQKAAATTRSKSTRIPHSGGGQQYYQIHVGKNQRGVNLDFPAPNDYFEHGAILLLRNAFELYQRDDLLSDLFAYFRLQLDKAPQAERLHVYFGLSCLHWWNDEKEEAVRALMQASDAVPQDLALRLEIARLYERMGDFEEALTVADSIAPLDHTTLQDRETLALSLSVKIGDIARARQAAERLFGLRLDTETQIQLSGQMRQLGMHDLAEAVLSRAQRRAGNRTSTLVSLMLQYQGESKVDVAAQVAHEILRRPAPQQSGSHRGGDEEDGSRVQAMQVLARLGKLKEMIARAEAQLKNSPHAIQLHKTLAQYYQAAGDREKSLEVYERMARLQPDNARLRIQIATQYFQNGKYEASLEHFRAALKKEPSLFAEHYWQIQQAYQQAKKSNELATLFEELNLKSLGGNYWTVMSIVQNVMQNEKTRDAGIKLFKRAWDAFPSQRIELLASIHNDQAWQMPEMYDYVRQTLLPGPVSSPDPWASFSRITSYDGNGRVRGVVTSLLDVAARQNKLDALKAEVSLALKKTPDWRVGQALLALIDVRLGQFDESKTLLQRLLDDKGDPIPAHGCWIIGQELENYGPMQALSLKVYESTLTDPDEETRTQYSYSPVRRLAALYHKSGRTSEARTLVLKMARKKPEDDYNPGYGDHQQVQNMSTAAEQLLEFGYPVDAAKMYNELLSDTSRLRNSSRWGGGEDQIRQHAQRGFSKALKALSAKSLAPAIREWLKPQTAAASGAGSAVEGSAIDLVLLVQPNQLERAALTSVFVTTIRAAAKTPELKAELHAGFARLLEQHPHDISVHVASTLAAFEEGKPEIISAEVNRLLKLADETPLENLAPGVRANARQRAEAAKQLGLWLAARECLSNDAFRAAGERLTTQALEAARRQADSRISLAILREWGKLALDRGDREAAEDRWSQMLDVALRNPLRKAPSKEQGVFQPVVPAATAPQPRPATAKPATAKPVTFVAPVSEQQFGRAVAIARMAARQDLNGLSMRAIRQALAGGPPVDVDRDSDDSGVRAYGRGMSVGYSSDDSSGTASREQQIDELVRFWISRRVPAGQVYETLLAVVLPESRISEIFLYSQPLATGPMTQPRSVGRMLAQCAVKAGRADDLRARIEARLGQPLVELDGRVVLAQLGLAGNNAKLVLENLTWLSKRMQKDLLQNTAELACHAALPALGTSELSAAALSVVELAAHNLETSSENVEPAGSFFLVSARFHFQQGRPIEGRKRIQEYTRFFERMQAQQRGDTDSSIQRQHLAEMAVEFARARQLNDALETLGRLSDLPDKSEKHEIADVLAWVARELTARPARERYELLQPWTMPTKDRRSVRFLAAFIPTDVTPAIFKTPANALERPGLNNNSIMYGGRVFSRGLSGSGFFSVASEQPEVVHSNIASTALILIDAARELGKLKELADAAEAAAMEKIENAVPLLGLIQIAQGTEPKLEPRAKPALPEPVDPAAPVVVGAEPDEPAAMPAITWGDYLIVRACLERPQFSKLGERLARELIAINDDYFNPFLRSDLSRAVVARAPGARLAARPDPRLKLWQPHGQVETLEPGAGRWISHEGHFVRTAGQDTGTLHFKYPLTGSFKFSADCISESDGMAGLNADMGFNGISFLSLGQGVSLSPARDCTRISLQVEPSKVRYIVNGHLLYEETDPSSTSPWLSLSASFSGASAFRNLRLEGSPRIPREIPLVIQDRLEGWNSDFYQNSQPPSHSERNRNNQTKTSDDEDEGGEEVPDEFDWRATDGIIVGRRRNLFDLANGEQTPFSAVVAGPSLDEMEAIPSLLSYGRPLQDDEIVRYEFFYEPDRTLVHPALGQLAFLLEPKGIRLHWMLGAGSPRVFDALTLGGIRLKGMPGSVPGDEMSDFTVEARNVADEPGNRRGPDRLPLKPGKWNTMQVRLAKGLVLLELNGVPVYERKLEPANDRQFGFFHYAEQSDARVRNVILRGDAWPATLTVEQSAGLTATAEEPTISDRHVLATLIGEELLSRNARYVLEQSRRLPLAERFSFLSAWVLPGDDHVSFRLAGHFTPTDPVPSAGDKPDASIAGKPARVRQHVGGVLESPAHELIAAARELGRIDELTDRIQKLPAESEYDERCKGALLILAAIAVERDAQAVEQFKSLAAILARVEPDAPEWTRWPELIATAEAVRRPTLVPAVQELTKLIVVEQFQKGHRGFSDAWKGHVYRVRAEAQLLALPEKQRRPFGEGPALRQWTPVTHAQAKTRGMGLPAAHWNASNGELVHYPGHNHDFLYFGTPLRGNFEVSGEVFGGREMQFTYGGVLTGLGWNRKDYFVSHFGRQPHRVDIKPPLEKVDDAYQCRLVVKDNQYALFVNGRKIFDQQVSVERDPWFALYQPATYTGGVRHLKITGQPTIPESLDLSQSLDLTGWLADYYDETTGQREAGATWQKRGEEIHGELVAGHAGRKQESVLQYHRPLLEDGEIEYQFYYDPGKAQVHPALDRLTFLLDPQGVKVHWMTDGEYDRTGLPPENVSEANESGQNAGGKNATVEPGNRRAPPPVSPAPPVLPASTRSKLPLIAKDWNRLKLSLSGDVVRLVLNGQEICQRVLEPTNQRVFGLFHYADETEVRVKTVIYRGNWPRTLPMLQDQELAATRRALDKLGN